MAMNELCVSCHFARMRDDICGIYCTGGFVESDGKCRHYKDCEEELEETDMTREEIVTALRCHCDAIETGKCPKDKCPSFERPARYKCAGVVSGEAADLIENQQRHIEALMKANDSLKDAIARRDEQIEKLAADRKALINELCQYCGKHKQAHEGVCDGCKWREM